MQDTKPLLLETDFPNIRRNKLETLQVNLGYLCNLSCTHCHVSAGPNRTELMNRETVDLVLEFIARHRISTLDMTGGSPEMNPHFRYLVTAARAMEVTVMDRCNPTILVEPGYAYLPAFLAENEIVVIASMPCYQQRNVDAQRGKDAYARSIRGLLDLNAQGYGKSSTGLVLNLVYNPDEAILPPPQDALEAEYKRQLFLDHGIVFNELYCLANMPIGRFGARLLAKGSYTDYMMLLRDSYSERNLDTVMCRNLISVDYRGYVYDCDFNQMLDIPINATEKARPHLRDLLDTDIADWPIASGEHCFGCTAGQGSSCGGALS